MMVSNSLSRLFTIIGLVTEFSFAALFGLAAQPTAPSDEGIAFFEKKIRPVLIEHCYQCHAATSEKLKGGLLLDTREGGLRGGDTGPAIIPGEPDNSLLMTAIHWKDADLEMPPKQKLTSKAIADFERWIRMGAPDSRHEDSPLNSERDPTTIDLVEGRKFWSFRPVVTITPPHVTNAAWVRQEIDQFVLAGLESKELRPAQQADWSALIRRLFVDLIGLPPSPERLKTLLQADDREAAYASLVDELLMSPHFGERWGRHWLDLARYADSTGGGSSVLYPDAWKYRDYVIASFNQDKPYSVFVREQVAGDLLASRDAAQRAEQLTATGFLVIGPRNYINDDDENFMMDGVDEQLDTIGRVFLGLALGCARCHDHKFDPVPMKDYYALAGILASTRTAEHLPANKNYIWETRSDPIVDPDGSRLDAFETQTLRMRTLQAELKEVTDAKEKKSRQEAIALLRDTMPPQPPLLMAVRCEETPGDIQLRLRGNAYQKGKPIPRGLLQVVAWEGMATHPEIPKGESGRRELAEWLAADQNPLTARVMANRIWFHLFGEGLVRTVDNFGLRGEVPTDPALLDWLAADFVLNGWSVKTLVRKIVLSSTYRLGVAQSGDEALIAGDPENRWFGRRVRQLLDAETLRDTLLSVSGQIDVKLGGPSISPKAKSEFDYRFDSLRRSVYVPRFRNESLEIFNVFDAASPSLSVGQRDRTILSTQALFLLNDEWVVEQARATFQRMSELAELNKDTARIEWLSLAILGRLPTENEISRALEFVDGGAPDVWAAFVQAQFAHVDFRFVR